MNIVHVNAHNQPNIFSSGPSSMMIYVSPVAGYQITEWTLSSLVWRSQARWGNRDQHIVRFFNAIEVEPFNFSLDMEVGHTSKKIIKHENLKIHFSRHLLTQRVIWPWISQ